MSRAAYNGVYEEIAAYMILCDVSAVGNSLTAETSTLY